jgi:hypothetical protein
MQTTSPAQRPATRDVLNLDRRQTKILADAVEALVRVYGNRARAARELDVKEHVLQAVTRNRTARIGRTNLMKLAASVGVDVSGWYLSTE